MRAVGLAMVAGFLIVACGQTPQGHPIANASVEPSPSPSASSRPSPSSMPTVRPTPASPSLAPTPRVSRTLLFAVLEAKGTTNNFTYNTVAIAGLDGYARAKTTFTPIPTPSLGCMGPVPPAQAYVAAGKVFFADGKGVIRSLAIDGTVAVAATFPLTSTQQMISFAVSPDGKQLLGTIYTTPKNAFSCTGSPSSGGYALDAYAASNGGPSRLVYHETWTAQRDVLALTGWDRLGPIGTYPTVWATQGGGPGSDFGFAVRVDARTIKPGMPVAQPSTCQVWNSAPSGTYVCLDDRGTTFHVKQADGTEQWRFDDALSPLLASDENRVVTCCIPVGQSVVSTLIGKDRTRVNLGAGAEAVGWLDSSTVIARANSNRTIPDFTLCYIALNSPQVVVSMGFSGLFVGTVRG